MTFLAGLADEQNRRYPTTPETILLANVTMYNLGQLRQAIHAAAEASRALDDRMNRASRYFAQTLFLYEKRQELARP